MKQRTILKLFMVAVGYVLVASSHSACGNAKTDDSSKATSAESKRSSPSMMEPSKTPALKTAAPQSSTQEEERLVATWKARASSTSETDGFPKDFDLSIEVSEGGTARGSATIGEATLGLEGDVADGAVRLWAEGNKKSVLRGGFFIGEIANQTASGKFALSGSGGNPNFRGTWKSI